MPKFTEEDIVFVSNYYRYVNHKTNLASMGFKTKEALLKYDILYNTIRT
jgi:hypothetical protein